MKKLYLIGIGPGNPEYLTIQAIEAMKRIDVFFLFEKPGIDELIQIRREILERYLKKGKYRVVMAKSPKLKKGKAYIEKVKIWRKEKARLITDLIKNKLKDGESGAFLILGDPGLYDGSLEILKDILKQGEVSFEYEVIPGISSIQVLAARHKIPLNYIGESILITPGRRLKKEKALAENTVVLLDSSFAFRDFKEKGLNIYWGAYLGMPGEVLVSGKLEDVEERIENIRKRARKKKGWIMDTYLLRHE